MTARTLSVVLAVVVLAGCGSSVARGGSGTVTSAGHVGTLRIDVSTATDVVRFAGRPDHTVTARMTWPDVPRYHALGYGCVHAIKRLRAYGGDLPQHWFCRTIYYVSSATHRLVAFWTDSPGFASPTGSHPGMAQLDAERREHSKPVGPWEAVVRESRRAILIMQFSCVPFATRTCRSGRVTGFRLESRHHPIGLSFT